MISGFVAYLMSQWFTHAIIPKNLNYGPIDSDNFMEDFLKKELTTEFSSENKPKQKRLDDLELKQTAGRFKSRLKEELRKNLQRINYSGISQSVPTDWLMFLDVDNFTEDFLKRELATELNSEDKQNRLSSIEIKQVENRFKKRLKEELRKNLQRISYNVSMNWLMLLFVLSSVLFLVIIRFWGYF